LLCFETSATADNGGHFLGTGFDFIDGDVVFEFAAQFDDFLAHGCHEACRIEVAILWKIDGTGDIHRDVWIRLGGGSGIDLTSLLSTIPGAIPGAAAAFPGSTDPATGMPYYPVATAPDGFFTQTVGGMETETVALVKALTIGDIQALTTDQTTALTTVQEMTLSFVPKMLAMMLAMVLLLPFMLSTLAEFTRSLFDQAIAGG